MKGNIIPPLITDTPAGISIYSVTCQAPHHHEDFLEIIYCFKGPVNISTRSQQMTINDGDIISCDPYDIHWMVADNKNMLVSFYFDLRSPIFNKPHLEKLYFMCDPKAVLEEKQAQLPDLKRLLLTMLYFYCFPHPQLATTEMVTTFSKKIIQAMLNHFHYFYYLAGSADYTDEMKDRFERIIIFIEDNYSKKITLGKLCQMEHFNYKYLSLFFKKTSRAGFSKFLNDIRTYKATALLLDTDKNISDIAYETGFSAPAYFYKVFKLWHDGTTPHQYRKMLRSLTEKSKEDVRYDILDKKEELEHFISFYFAQLQVPQLWRMPFVPFTIPYPV